MPAKSELLRFLERSPIGVLRSDARGRIVRANSRLAAILEYSSPDELLALTLHDLYVDPTLIPDLSAQDSFVDAIRAAWKTRTGEVHTMLVFGQVAELATGVVFDATVIDLTQLAATETKLRVEREERELTTRLLDTVMHQVPALYYMVDRDLRIVRTGGAVEQILGYPANRFVGGTLYDAINADPTDRHTIEHHQRALAGEVIAAETEYRGKQLANVIAPWRNDDGVIVAAIGTSIDVTSWRLLERRMVDAQRAESLGVLAGGLAHDFNNLLAAVLGNADLALREIPVGQPGHAALENIQLAGLRAAELTNELLAYAGRGGAGTARIEPGLVVEELLRILGPSLSNEVEVSVDIPARLAVRGDPGQLRQVLLNLIHNARDALQGRGGHIHVRAQALHLDGPPDVNDILTAAAGSYVLLEVGDDGPGMDPETRRHVFEPFFTTKQTGHGLGLAAVLGIVRAHGGGVRVVSAPQQGARFQILWPTAVTAAMPAVENAAPASRTVLVIDDEDIVRDVVARMVEDLGYAALTAADGKAGLAVLDRQPVDAVLVDLTMPHMSGIDVVAAVRQRRPETRVVVCSGYDRDSRGPIHADAFLPKPFRIDALERTLAKLLPLRSV